MPANYISQEKLRSRAIEVERLAREAEEAAKKAREANKNDLAAKLKAKAAELHSMAANYNTDTLPNPESHQETALGSESQEDEPQKTPEEPQSEEQQSETPQPEPQQPEEPQGAPEEQLPDNPASKPDGKPQEKGSNGGKPQQSNNEQGSEESGEDSGDEPGGDTGEESGESEEESGEESEEESEGGSKGDTGKESEEESEGESEEESEEGYDDEPDDGPEINTKGESEEESEEEGQEENPDDPVEDIFDMTPPKTGQQGYPQNSKEPRKPTADEIIKMLSKLKGDAKRGAIDGIKSLLDNDTNESLQEDFNNKGLRDLTDDEYADGINSILDLIQQATEIDVRSAEDNKGRLNKINNIMDDPKVRKELEKENNVEIAKDFQKKKARDAENAKYANYRSIEQFKLNFYNAINDQVEMTKLHVKSYNEINPEYEGENIIVKADIDKNVEDLSIPVVNFYFDVSGSWTGHPDAIRIGQEAVATVKEFEDRGECKLNIYYFGNNISTDMYDYGVWGSGTGAWQQILQNITATGANNVVLMTDGDMAGDAYRGPTCVVDGCVWYIWSLYDYKEGSTQILKHLYGRGSNNQYSFGAGGQYPPYGNN